MTRYQMFETMEEVKEFKKSHGGVVVDFAKNNLVPSSLKKEGKTNRDFYSDVAGANTNGYNYAVEWNE